MVVEWRTARRPGDDDEYNALIRRIEH